MAKRKRKDAKNGRQNGDAVRASGAYRSDTPEHRLHPDTKKSIWAISFICVAAVLVLAWNRFVPMSPPTSTFSELPAASVAD